MNLQLSRLYKAEMAIVLLTRHISTLDFFPQNLTTLPFLITIEEYHLNS